MRTLLLLTLLPLLSFQQPKTKAVYTEDQKISYIINSLGRLDAVFVRNDSEYSPADAMDHLKMKRKKAGSSIKTARQFIKEIASKSSVSGKPYTIKFKDGHTETAENYLTQQLDKLETSKR